MMGSGVLEWIRQQLFSGTQGEAVSYEDMIAAARAVAPGADGVSLIPAFVADTGPTKKYDTKGTILGLTMTTTAAQIYRAGLEGLCFQMRWALEIIQALMGVGQFDSIEQAMDSTARSETVYEPSDVATEYDALYERYRKVPLALRDYYGE